MASPARVPSASYPRSRFASSASPLPGFLRLVTALVVLVLGAGGVGAYVWTAFIHPRILRTQAARDVLEADHAARLERVQRRLSVLVGVRAGSKTLLPSDEPPNEDEKPAKEDAAVEEKEVAPTATATDAEQPPTDIASPSVDDEPASLSLIAAAAGRPSADVFALPESDLLDLAGALPLLAPRPRPGGLVRSLTTASRAWTSAALSFSAKTPRTGAYGNSLSNSLERAGALGTGGAWGSGAGVESAGVGEVLALIGGLRGDVKGMKGGLLSRKAFPMRRGRPGGETVSPPGSLTPSPASTPPPVDSGSG